MNTLTFEVGDRVHCPYYNVTGFIESIHANPNAKTLDMELADIINIKTDGDNIVNTKVVNRSSNSPVPTYLQMICKKGEVNWGHIDKGVTKR